MGEDVKPTPRPDLVNRLARTIREIWETPPVAGPPSVLLAEAIISRSPVAELVNSHAELEAKAKLCDRMAEALGFYADESHYGWHGSIETDNGCQARAILAELAKVETLVVTPQAAGLSAIALLRDEVKKPRNPDVPCPACGEKQFYTDYYDVCYGCGRNVEGETSTRSVGAELDREAPSKS